MTIAGADGCKRSLQVGFPASGSLSGYLGTLHLSHVFPLFISPLRLCVPFLVSCFQIVFIKKKKTQPKPYQQTKVEFIVTDLNVQTLILVRHTLWVGFSCLSIKPRCALEDAVGQLTWVCICLEGHKVLSHLSASWRHFQMPQGS